MSEAFVIMQIGNPELDKVYEQVIAPTLKACGLDPKRVDKHNRGGLLKSEIIGYIQKAEIIVADLTNERPNCYLEVGYAMGKEKYQNLILTAREDHNPSSADHIKGGSKVHFDLLGYDILFWKTSELDSFTAELRRRIGRRRALSPLTGPSAVWDENWISSNRAKAKDGLAGTGNLGFMEVCFALTSKVAKARKELLQAAEEAPIHTFGWPIGIFSREHPPMPTPDGILADIPGPTASYDYWTIRHNGDFYLLKSLFEDERKEGHIYFNTRIVRVTETLLYANRLYEKLGVASEDAIAVRISHGGLKGRCLSATADRRWPFPERNTGEMDEQLVEHRFTLGELETDTLTAVIRFCAPLFELFNYKEFDRSEYEHIVNSFKNGKCV